MISHKYKFVCLALPRCCSTTLAHILKPVVNNHIKFISNEHRQVEIYDEITNKKIRHANITHFINLYGEKILKDYYKFCVIRNPWDRIISFVSHLVHKKGTYPFEKIEIALDTYSDWINIYPHISYDNMPTMDKYILYDNFAQEMKEVLEKLCVPYDEVLFHKRINKIIVIISMFF